MARITSGKVFKIMTQLEAARTRSSKWITDLNGMLTNPKGSDGVICTDLREAREQLSAARDGLRLASAALDRAHVATSRREAK